MGKVESVESDVTVTLEVELEVAEMNSFMD